ncbi:MAG: hypothetical protein E6G10_04935 [Actinobacteria bacterium]|nr:MAG: hypothetical protein E6G10_04935 [Actinomycetota bacterium]
MADAVLERRRRAGGAHRRAQRASGQGQLAPGALEHEIERVHRGLGGGVGERLEVALEPGVQRAVEPGGQVVARLPAQPAGATVHDDEHRRTQHEPVALGARDGGRRALDRLAGSVGVLHVFTHRRASAGG